MCETEPNTPGVEPIDPPTLDGEGEALPSTAENAALPHITHPLVACFEVGMLLNQLDFHLRVAYMAWDRESFAAANDSWKKLLVAVRSLGLTARRQYELCQVIEQHRDSRKNVYFSEDHRDHLENFGNWESIEHIWGGLPQVVGALFGPQGPTREVHQRIFQRLSEQQVTFLHLGELLDRGDRSSRMYEESLCTPDYVPPVSGDNAEGEQLPVRQPVQASGVCANAFPVQALGNTPAVNREAWLEELQVSWEQARQLLPRCDVDATNIEFNAEHSVEELANRIRQAITAAVAEIDDSTSENEPQEGAYLGVTMDDVTGVISRAGFGQITIETPHRQSWNLLKHFLSKRGQLTTKEWFQGNWKQKQFGTKANPRRDVVYKAISQLNELISQQPLLLCIDSDLNRGWRLVDLEIEQKQVQSETTSYSG